MHTLPAGLWDSNVSFDTEMTDLENGCDWVIRAPLGIYQHSKWLIENALETDGGEENKLCLVEDTSITCSKLLVGTVKGKCEANWKGTHGKFVERLAATDKH